MEFPPVSLGDEDPLLYHSQSEALGNNDISAGDNNNNNNSKNAGGNLSSGTDLTALSPDTPLSEAIRRCLQGYYHELNWNVPFPQHQAAPLLYLPQECRKLRYASDSFGVMGSELDVLSRGMLERIPLGYFPLQLEDVEEGLKAAEETRGNIHDMQSRVKASGQIQRAMWKAAEVNTALEPEDIKLLDTDIDQRLEHRRDLPSITLLLQRPTYTEMSSDSSPEQRHATRLSRAVPEPVRRAIASQQPNAIGAAAAGLSSPTSPALQSPLFGGGESGGAVEGVRESSPGLQPEDSAVTRIARAAEDAGLGPESKELFSAAQLLHLAKKKKWPEEVKRSFRCARTVDEQYLAFLKDLTGQKLGLDSKCSEHLHLTIQIWHAMWTMIPTPGQQRGLWVALCQYSYEYNDNQSNGDGLVKSVAKLKLPDFQRVWIPLLEMYASALNAYIHEWPKDDRHKSLKERLDARKANLKIDGEELQISSSSVHLQLPQLQIGKCLQRHSAKVLTRNQPISIYPVSVTPIFPSGFEEAARLQEEWAADRQKKGSTHRMGSPLEELELDFLAEGADTLEHMVLPGAVIPEKRCAKRGPHVLVNGTNLLCADAASVEDIDPLRGKESSDGVVASNAVPIGGTMVYHTLEENTFETLYTDEDNTSSYVFHQFESPIFNAMTKNESGGTTNFTMPENLRSQQQQQHHHILAGISTHPILKSSSSMFPLPLEPMYGARQAGMAGRPRPTPLQGAHTQESDPSQTSQPSLLGDSQASPSGSQQQSERRPSGNSSSAPLWSVVQDAAKRGAVGVDGSVLTYNRIGLRGQFQKAARGEQLPVDRYAIVFAPVEEVLANSPPQQKLEGKNTNSSSTMPTPPADDSTRAVKREREEGDSAEDHRISKVKLEPQS